MHLLDTVEEWIQNHGKIAKYIFANGLSRKSVMNTIRRPLR